MSQGFKQEGGSNYQGTNQGWRQNQEFNANLNNDLNRSDLNRSRSHQRFITNPYHGSNQPQNYPGCNSNLYNGSNQSQHQGWNNIPVHNQGWNNNQTQYQGWRNNPNQFPNQNLNQTWGQNSTQGWSNNPNQGVFNQGSTSGWGNQSSLGNNWGSSYRYNYHNPFGMSIPQISFIGGCRKCNGSGNMIKRGRNIPCRRCYKQHGYCPKCYGTGINFMKNIPCRKCQRTGQYRSSSSSPGIEW